MQNRNPLPGPLTTLMTYSTRGIGVFSLNEVEGDASAETNAAAPISFDVLPIDASPAAAVASEAAAPFVDGVVVFAMEAEALVAEDAVAVAVAPVETSSSSSSSSSEDSPEELNSFFF